MTDTNQQDNPLPLCAESKYSRRNFLSRVPATVAGIATAVGLAAGTKNFVAPTPALAQSRLDPDAALKKLMEGNRRFISGQTTAHQRNLSALRQQLAEKQEPFAAVLSCADSRVPVGMVFDQSIGDLFVNRVAGNIITPEIIGSLEYGVAVLGTKVILVLGHSSCGAVKAAIAGKSVPGQISSLYPHLQPAVNKAGHDTMAAIKANASIQSQLLSQSSTVIAESIKEGRLKVVAGYYDIGSGKVTLLS